MGNNFESKDHKKSMDGEKENGFNNFESQDHMAPAVAFANRGYHVLVEKPMAVTEEDCR